MNFDSTSDLKIVPVLSTEVNNRLVGPDEILRVIDTGALYVAGPGGEPQSMVTATTLDSEESGKGADLIAFKNLGTGAVKRNVNEKLKDAFISIQDFGAAPSKSADLNVAAILAAGQSAISFGKALYIPAGTYMINGSLRFEQPLTIFGDGDKSVLKIDQSLSLANKRFIPLLFQNTAAGIPITGKMTLSDFAIDASNGGLLNAGVIVLNSVDNFVVERLHLYDGGTPGAEGSSGVNGIGVSAGTYGGAISSGVIRDCLMERFTKAPINWTTEARDGLISGNCIRNNTGNGQTPGIQVNGGYNCAVVQNFVYGNEGAGIIIGTSGTDAGTFRHPRRTLVSGNYCFRNGTGSVLGHGIYVGNSSAGAYSFGEIRISENWCYHNGVANAASGIFVENETNVVVAGNKCQRNRSSGITVTGSVTKKIKVHDNVLNSNNLLFNAIESIAYSTGVATVTTKTAHGLAIGNSIGIYETNEYNFSGLFTVASVTSANTFTVPVTDAAGIVSDRDSGIVVNYTTGASHRMYSTGAGVFLQATSQGSDIEIYNNTAFDSHTTKSQQYGIYCNSSTALSSITIVDNVLSGNAIQEIGFLASLPHKTVVRQRWEKDTSSASAAFPIICKSASGGAYLVKFSALARKYDGSAAGGYIKVATLLDTAGAVAIVSSETPIHMKESMAGLDAAIVTAADQIRFQITGDSSAVTNWIGEYEISSLS
jgi:hypothetical protein